MAVARFFTTHHTWEDWAGMIVGALVALSPWLTGQTAEAGPVWSAVIIGALVIAFAALQLFSLQLWEDGAQILCGLWLITAPFNLAYGGTLATWHFVLGTIVIVLALVELLQDWRLSDDELARHGQ